MNSKDERGQKRPPLPELDPSKRKRDPNQELEINFDDDVFDRVTKRPAVGPEKFAAEVMRRSGEMPESGSDAARNPTPLSMPPALGGAPPRAQDASLRGTEQQDTTSAISFPALEMPSISPNSVRERADEPHERRDRRDAGDDFGGSEGGRDHFFDDLPEDSEALDLGEVPRLPKRPPPAGSSLDPFHASLAREQREAGGQSPRTPTVTLDDDDSDLPPALGGGRGPSKRGTPISEVPAAFGPPSGALAFVDRQAHPSVDLTPSKHLPPVLTPSKLPKAHHHRPSEPPTSQRLRERYALGDFSGALEIAEAILLSDPDSTEALRFAKSCRDVLMQMYTARLSPMGRRVRIAVAPDQLRWLSLDHRAGFLLSLIDGASTVDELLDVCGMPRINALKILCALVEQEVIELL